MSRRLAASCLGASQRASPLWAITQGRPMQPFSGCARSSSVRSKSTGGLMKLREMDLSTLAAVKAGLTLDERDGTLLGNAEVLLYTAQIAPHHYLYAEF